MTKAVGRRIGRVWTTILVVYALLLAGLVPVQAVQRPADLELVICTVTAHAPDRPAPHDGTDHDDPCCILCQAPASVGRPAQGTLDLAPPPVARSATFGPPAAPRLTRAPPGATPQSPRAPPILS